ncbi:MarR family winged helix-turn-helix transcriptional regulator [Streptomyces sp. NPDC048281]|uniref:MarR family winged helix-turn-helix transcriptional regulator n=1 Tax=Streptomyces sp. NPDC048281 TaxID=3154715 RepID=UPI003413CF11
MTTLMDKGDLDLRYGSATSASSTRTKAQHRHAILCAAAAGAVRAGWSRDQFSEAMITWPSLPGSFVREMSQASAERHLDKIWGRVLHHVRTTRVVDSRQESVVDLIALRDTIASASSWRGTPRSTELRVLMAHWHAAKKSGGRMYTLAYREAAESAGCETRTAYLATQRLITSGWLRHVDAATADKGTTWYIRDGSQQRHTLREAQPGGAESNVSELRNGGLDGAVIERLMSLDAFAHRGLGSSSLKLLAALHLRDPQSVAELTDTAMVSPATAYRHLPRLAEHGLVVREAGLWKLTETAAEALSGAWEGWDTVAAEIGTYGTAWRRQQTHKDQRAVWRGMVIPRLRERRMPDVQPVRGDEVSRTWRWGNEIIDPTTGEIIPDIAIASDGRLILTEEELSYEELTHKKWLSERCSTFFSLLTTGSFR